MIRTVRETSDQTRRSTHAVLILLKNTDHHPHGHRMTVRDWDRVTSREDARGLIVSILNEDTLFGGAA